MAFDLADGSPPVPANIFIEDLAADLVGISYDLRQGDLAASMDALEVTTDRLHQFLYYVVTLSETLAGTHDSLGAVVADYGRRLLDVATRLEEALASHDLVAVTACLEHGLARALREHARYEPWIERALAPAPQPMAA